MIMQDFYDLCDSLPLDENGCKVWTGSRLKAGYPQVYVPGHPRVAHRLVLERKLGRSIKPGYYACHSCDKPHCVNEEHLFEGTPHDNLMDASRKNRFPTGAKHWLHNNPRFVGERNPQATITADIVRQIRVLREQGKSYKQITSILGVSASIINGVINNRNWTHVK